MSISIQYRRARGSNIDTEQSIPIPPFRPEGITGVRPTQTSTPNHITVVRLHAFGDAVITLPVLAGLRTTYPNARIDLVTLAPYAELFESTGLLDAVWPFTDSAARTTRGLNALLLATRLGTPDLFIDLQRNGATVLLRRLLRPSAWVAFDRFAPTAALERYLEATRWIVPDLVLPNYQIPLRPPLQRRAVELLDTHGYHSDGDDSRPLICLNPAGGWPTKNWPVAHYVTLATMMVEAWNARIVLLGTEHIRPGGLQIVQALGDDVIDLIGTTSVAEAMGVVSHLKLMVSDDSGLMHLAWTCGVPTVGIFGATRSGWSRPYGPHSFCFGSEDLDCGACMSPVCRRNDLHCLERVDPVRVFAECERLLRQK